MTSSPAPTAWIADLRRTLARTLAGRPVHRVILFGSRARGDADEYSDTDLVIVAGTDRPFPDRCRDYLDLLEVIAPPVEMLIYTPEEFEQMRGEERPFLMQILEEGVEVYEGPEEGRRALVSPGGE